MKVIGTSFIFMVLYVDDILLATNDTLLATNDTDLLLKTK